MRKRKDSTQYITLVPTRPRCPKNCTINTYYDAENHVCLSYQQEPSGARWACKLFFPRSQVPPAEGVEPLSGLDASMNIFIPQDTLFHTLTKMIEVFIPMNLNARAARLLRLSLEDLQQEHPKYICVDDYNALTRLGAAPLSPW